jgi:predicted PurR-regulated permease PerM
MTMVHFTNNYILKILYLATLEEFNLNLESAKYRNLPLNSARIPSSFLKFSLKYRRLLGKNIIINVILIFIILFYFFYFCFYFLFSLIHKVCTTNTQFLGEIYAYTEYNHNIDFILNDLINVKFAIVRPSYNPLRKFAKKNLHTFQGLSSYALISYKQIFMVLFLSIFLIYFLLKKEKYHYHEIFKMLE